MPTSLELVNQASAVVLYWRTSNNMANVFVVHWATNFQNNRMDKVKIAAVSYLNTIPFLHGLQNSGILSADQYQLSTQTPAQCASQLLNGTVDLALVPVRVVPLLKKSYIVADYCIGADGPVGSVLLVSKVPLEQITEVVLDYQSRTSVALAQVLFKAYWKKDVVFVPAKEGFEEEISGTKAAVIIGDRTFKLNSAEYHLVDLAQAWKLFADKPFVFAAWVSNKQLSAQFLACFNRALQYGVLHTQEAIAAFPIDCGLTEKQKLHYLTERIVYPLQPAMRDAMELFWRYCSRL